MHDVLLLIGSHKRGGFSERAAEWMKNQLEASGKTVEILTIRTLRLEHCLDCPYCEEHCGKCVIDDDMNHVYAKLKAAQHLVVLTPVYFNGVPSRLKVLIDRTQMIFMTGFAHKQVFPLCSDESQKGAYIVSFGGAKAYEHQFYGVASTLDWVFRNLKMPLRAHAVFSGTDHIERGVLTEAMIRELTGILKEIVER